MEDIQLSLTAIIFLLSTSLSHFFKLRWCYQGISSNVHNVLGISYRSLKKC